MKKFYTFITFIIFTSILYAQVPQKINYQAVVRDNSNQLVTEQQLSVKISIIPGQPDGLAVYTEEHSPTSNANGLFNIEIGTGNNSSGVFNEIDWSSDIYFIMTQIDPEGGSSYTLSATSQLLSVPYALHSATAESLTGTLNETDPVFSASASAAITSSDISGWNSKLDSYTESDPVFEASPAKNISAENITGWNAKLDAEVDGSVTNELQTISKAGLEVTLSGEGGSFRDSINTYTAGTGIEINDFVISATSSGTTTYEIGDYAQGGIVFYVDETGQHGLVCAKSDLSEKYRWYAGTYGWTRAAGDGVGSGEMNTAIIIPAHTAIGDDGTSYAALECSKYMVSENGRLYGDWYLPSKQELRLLCNNTDGTKEKVNATAVANGGTAISDYTYYWSSNEYLDNKAYCVNAYSGVPGYDDKLSSNSVRPIRAF